MSLRHYLSQRYASFTDFLQGSYGLVFTEDFTAPKNRKHKKSREVLADVDLKLHKEAMRLEKERSKNKEVYVI